MGQSLAERFAALDPASREQWVRSQGAAILEQMVRGEWWWTSRPEQVPPPGDWLIHLALAGRGWGKSRAGSEWIVESVEKHPHDRHGVRTEWLVIAETLSDARIICIEGPAGLLRVIERKGYVEGETYFYTKMPKPKIELVIKRWDEFQSKFTEYRPRIYFEGADKADVGRGYNAAGGWLDEIAKWKDPSGCWVEGIMPSLRADLIDDHPRVFVTTTPKPIVLLQEWLKRDDGSVSVVRGSTYDNSANLSSHVLEELRKRYEGTAIGRQELYGELLEAMEGVLFKYGDIDRNRFDDLPQWETARVLGVDPSLTGEEDEMGLVVASRDERNHMYILADESQQLAGRDAAVHIWRTFAAWSCDIVVYENELGKRWMADVLTDVYRELRDGEALFEPGTTAPMLGVPSKVGKKLRAEPVANRYEQGTVHHVGRFDDLEQQLVTWDPENSKESPDRLDALVHACRWLMAGEKKQMRLIKPGGGSWIQGLRRVG